MDHGFFEAADPRPDPEELRAAMLDVDLIALRLRVAVAKADLQLRTARCAALWHSTRERLLSRVGREEQLHHLEDLRVAVSHYAHLLGATGASRDEVARLVKTTVEEVTDRGASESPLIRAIVSDVLQLFEDTPAA